jgi:hypothetical protein
MSRKRKLLVKLPELLLLGFLLYSFISHSHKNKTLQKRVDQQESEIQNLQYQLKMCMFLYRKCGG